MKNTQENTQQVEALNFDTLFQQAKKGKGKTTREFTLVEQSQIAVLAAQKGLNNIIIVDSLPVNSPDERELAKGMFRNANNHVKNTLRSTGLIIDYYFLNLQDLPNWLTSQQANFLRELYKLRHQAKEYVDYYQEKLQTVKAK
jgi:hypothetical protein